MNDTNFDENDLEGFSDFEEYYGFEKDDIDPEELDFENIPFKKGLEQETEEEGDL
jgi:hypothetical protein